MNGGESAWLLMPAHNEAPVAARARCAFPHVVCVDGGSPGGSGDLAHPAGATVIAHPFRLGQGSALQTDIDDILKRTPARYIVAFDADGQHRVRDAEAMVRAARERALAAVYGFRFLAGRPRMGASRRAVLRFGARVTRRRAGLRLTGAHNGLRVLVRGAAQAVRPRHNRMARATEIVGQLAHTGLPWAEMPVDARYTPSARREGQSLLNSGNIPLELGLG